MEKNTNIITRDKIQEEALNTLIKNNGGTLVISTGGGKSKVAIDYIKYLKPHKVLITSPRTNLKENWRKELIKWKFIPEVDNKISNVFKHLPSGDVYSINIENIQTCYKWSETEIAEYDLIIFDEVHTIATKEYGKLARKATKMGIKKVGLTATPDDKKKDKIAFYIFHCPIVYKYLDSAKDGITNKRKYIIYEYTLNNMFETEVKAGKKRWYSGEKKQYDYIKSQIKKGESLIRDILEIDDPTEYVNYFGYARSWYWNSNSFTPLEKKNAGGIYMRAITARKDLLWSLNSTASLAKTIREHILEKYDSKILIFSERTNQANKIATHVVHSKNKDEINEKNIKKFNSNEIKVLGSCNSLTLGLNLNKPKYAIMESYNGSDVIFKQRAGRTDRLPVTENAIVTFIVVKNTQSEVWFKRAVALTNEDEVKIVNNIADYQKVLKEMH